MASITRFYALILSTVLLLSGIPGFFPTVGSFQVLVSFFELTLVHSVVHVAVGLLGLMITALASDQSVRVYTIGISLLYGALMVVGLIGVNFAPVLVFNSADNWLHGPFLCSRWASSWRASPRNALASARPISKKVCRKPNGPSHPISRASPQRRRRK
jgi:hypothetical protein